MLFIMRLSPGTIPAGTAIAVPYYSELFGGGRNAVKSSTRETAEFEVRSACCRKAQPAQRRTRGSARDRAVRRALSGMGSDDVLLRYDPSPFVWCQLDILRPGHWRQQEPLPISGNCSCKFRVRHSVSCFQIGILPPQWKSEQGSFRQKNVILHAHRRRCPLQLHQGFLATADPGMDEAAG